MKTSCVYGNQFIPTENKRVVDEEIERVACPVTSDSIIVSRMNTPELVGNCGYVDRDYPNLFLPDRLWIARFSTRQKLHGKYAWYLCISDGISKLTGALATGTSGSMKNLSQEAFLNIDAIVPPLPEQTAIAVFLDQETGLIDTLVAKKRRLIALLKEKRTALISHIVTHGLPEAAAREFGLNPHTRFKDSGIEWLGQVPEEWDVLPFTKYVGEKSDYRGKTPEKTDDGIFLVTAKNVRMGFIDYETSKEYVAKEDYDEIMRRGLPKLGDILFTTEAPLGNVALVDDENVAMAQRIIRFRMRPNRFESKFTLYGMMSDHFQNQLKSLSTGSTAEGLKASKLTVLKLICPPLPEQTAIATYLNRETAKIDKLVEKIDAAIVRLQEYRTALITAAVTGKIDVREVEV
ncbi:restriction endonuclease subunit S [Aeromonas caviae]|nr:restriction endonuclease subunit S [Aeromonas caviae]MDF2276559.1 restriction endonuclease subunit S [Aeromonas caviae]